MDRREFIKYSGLLPLLASIPNLSLASLSYDSPKEISANKCLVLIELKGGNDGLNTLIPYGNEIYYQQRPSIAIPKKDILTLDQHIGLHPELKSLMPYWEKGGMVWLQGMGYERPNRSHFKSIEIWHTGSLKEDDSLEGWVARKLEKQPLKGVAIGNRLGPLYTEELSSIGLINPKQFAKLGTAIKDSQLQSSNNPSLQHILKVQQSVNDLSGRFMQHLQSLSKPIEAFPKHKFGKAMGAVHQLIMADLNIPVYKVSLGSFDTHVNQKPRQAKLLRQLATTLDIFIKNLQSTDKWNQTMIMTYSEFGRRLKENANKGTDHGAAAPHFVLGGKIKGGLYGSYPSLENLDNRGDLIYTTDFRDVYDSIGNHWWGISEDSQGNDLNFINT
jgi:uncharacterized protein (DUF1501 family)